MIRFQHGRVRVKKSCRQDGGDSNSYLKNGESRFAGQEAPKVLCTKEFSMREMAKYFGQGDRK